MGKLLVTPSEARQQKEQEERAQLEPPSFPEPFIESLNELIVKGIQDNYSYILMSDLYQIDNPLSIDTRGFGHGRNGENHDSFRDVQLV